jgi:hypothetical protein
MSILANSVNEKIVIRAVALTLALAGVCVAASAQNSGRKASQNHQPTVTLMVSPNTLCYGGIVKLFANADDPDGDRLTYKYTTNVGQIIGKGSKVQWKLGGMGYYEVVVEVSDGRGGAASSSAHITIFELCACPSLFMDGSVDAGRTRQLATFNISMAGPADLKPTYLWSVSAGKIIRGKRAPSITVDATGAKAEDITATVKIGGLAPECENTKSFTLKNPSHQAP